MPDQQGSHDEEKREQLTGTSLLNRRRLLQVAGVGIAGGVIATGGVLATSSDLPHMIVFDGSNTDSIAQYEFGVTGSVAPHGDGGALEDGDTIDGTSVVGDVHQATDAYQFSGNLTHLDVDGAVDVSISYAEAQSGTDKLEVVAPANTSIEYTFTSVAQVEKDTDNGSNSANEAEDSIWENTDGPWTVSGVTDDGDGDSYDLHGSVTSFGPIKGDFTLFLNGQTVTAAELIAQGHQGGRSDEPDGEPSEPQPQTLEIVAPSTVEYTVTATGQIEMVTKDSDNGAEEANDTVTENDDGTWTATGSTGNGYDDTYTFVGDIVEFEMMVGDAILYVDGEETTVSELVR